MNRCYTIGVITFVITFIIFYFFIYKNDEKRVSEHFDEEDKARLGNLMSDFQNALMDYVTKRIPQEKRQNLQKEIIKFVNSFTSPTSEYDPPPPARLISNILNRGGLNINSTNESNDDGERDSAFKDLNPSQILYKDNDELDNNSRYINKSELTIMINEYVEKLEENFPALHVILMDFINKNTPKTYS